MPERQLDPPANEFQGRRTHYSCADCCWHDEKLPTLAALDHHVLTGHRIRIRNCSDSWPDVDFGRHVIEHRRQQLADAHRLSTHSRRDPAA
jgi:hypothetical protein